MSPNDLAAAINLVFTIAIVVSSVVLCRRKKIDRHVLIIIVCLAAWGIFWTITRFGRLHLEWSWVTIEFLNLGSNLWRILTLGTIMGFLAAKLRE